MLWLKLHILAACTGLTSHSVLNARRNFLHLLGDKVLVSADRGFEIWGGSEFAKEEISLQITPKKTIERPRKVEVYRHGATRSIMPTMRTRRLN